ncbi:HNH endonuclease [Chloroflexota bacterium]
MRAYIGVTDYDWFNLLRNIPQLDEVNFWQPGGNRVFKALKSGELFLFKLHYPHNCIVGGGIFAHSTLLPVSLAWDSFDVLNGARSLEEVKTRVGKYRHETENINTDYTIGCIILEQPFFLSESAWIPVPGWKPSIVQGKTYDLSIEPGLSIWKELLLTRVTHSVLNEEPARYGEPVLVLPRLGQGSFRVLVTDAYERKCAVTRERTLPALDAAHIKPYSKSGQHAVNNGILMRRDLHALFDRGYITVSPTLNLEVSHKIKEEYENGRDYYRLHGTKIHIPADLDNHPSLDYIDWHNTNVYLG